MSALIKSLGRPLALGMLDEPAAICAVVLREPQVSVKVARHLLRQSAARFDSLRGRDEARIRRAVWPMCEQRKPGDQILAKARATVPDTMRDDEVLDLCRDVARSSQRRRA